MFNINSDKIKLLEADARKGRLCQRRFEHMERTKNRKISYLEYELEQCKEQVEVYKKKYADQLQLRLQLIEMVDKMEKRGN